MRSLWNCVIPPGSVLKGSECPFSHSCLLSTGWIADKIAKSERPSWTPWGRSHVPLMSGIRMIHYHKRRNLSLYFKMLPYQFWTAFFLTFYVREINFYLFKSIIILSFPNLTVNQSQLLKEGTKRIRYKGTCCKHGRIGIGHGTGQPSLVYLDLWALHLWVSLWISPY